MWWLIMKGVELPISTIVIIALILLVLLGVVALWISGFGGGAQGVTLEAAKSTACAEVMRYYLGCSAKDPKDVTIPNFDANANGKSGITEATQRFNDADPNICTSTSSYLINGDNLQLLCYCYYNAKTASDCRKVCGCGA
jgi:hypothetical protein